MSLSGNTSQLKLVGKPSIVFMGTQSGTVMSFRLNPKILLLDKASPALPAGNVGCSVGTVSEGVHCGGLLALLTNLLVLYP